MTRKSAGQWFREYGDSHRNPVNKFIHWICVPLIYLTIFGILWDLPSASWMGYLPGLNWAILVALPVMLFYWLLSPSLAKGLLIFTLLCFAGFVAYGYWYSTPLWLSCVVAFVVLWVGQFVGHYIEGKKPSFFKDLQFLLIGPAWLMAALYDLLGIRYDKT